MPPRYEKIHGHSELNLAPMSGRAHADGTIVGLGLLRCVFLKKHAELFVTY